MDAVVLNTSIGDEMYEMATQETGAADYAYGPEARTLTLTGRPTQYQQLAEYSEVAPEPPARTQDFVRVVKVQQLEVWPLWLGLGVTATVAIAALGYAASITINPVWTVPQTAEQAAIPCYCTPGTLTFALSSPGPCYRLADGSNGTPNLLRDGGLYIRSGALNKAGTVIEQATAVNGLGVTASATQQPELPVYAEQCTGADEGFMLSQTYSGFFGSRATVGPHCNTAITVTPELSGDNETRPPSVYLTPFICS